MRVSVTGFLILLSLFTFAQRGIVNNGAKISVSNGAVIKISGTEADYTNNSSGGFDGRIDLDGRFKLAGDWNNNATSGQVLINVDTDGEVIFEGTSQQTILGSQTDFEKVTINNTNDVALSTDITVNGDFTFTDGNLILGANNLTLSATASIIGAPSASKMFVASSTGELRKIFTANGSFTFPVGDNSVTVEYSPITLNFTSGSYGASAYAAVRLTDAKHPNNSSPSHYITRYWKVSQNNISSFSCGITGTYLNADVFGTEANLFTGRWDNTNWFKLDAVNTVANEVSGSVSEFGDFTAGEQAMFCSPPVSIVNIPTNTTCIGGNDGAIDLTVTNTVPTVIYNWTTVGGSGLINGIEDQSGLTEGIYYVTVTDGNDCSATDMITISYNYSVTANAGSDDDLCPGQTDVQLNAGGGDFYSWLPSTGLNFDNINNPIANPASTTTYTVTVTDTHGCSDTDDVIVTVNTLPTADAGTDGVICNGESVTIDASGSSGTATLSYNWDNGIGIGVSHSVSPASTTIYNVTVTDGNSCTDTDNVQITVNDLPVVDAGVDDNVANGFAYTFGATCSSTNSYTVSWTPSALVTNPTVENATTVGLFSTQIFTLEVTDDITGCVNSDDITITVTGGVITANPEAVPDTICLGETVQLSANPGGGGGSYTFSWTPTASLNDPNIENPIATPTVNTTYTVDVFDGANHAIESVDVVVYSLPTAVAGADDAVCNGESVTLTASGGDTYNWDNSVTQGTPFVPVATTTYTVTVTDVNGCTDTDNLDVTVYSLPIANAGADDAVCDGYSITIDASGSTGTPTLIYDWDNGLGAGASHIVTPVGNTTYSVTVTDGNSCTAVDDVFITVNANPVASAGSDETICNGDNVDLTASGGSSYEWSTLETTQTINVSPTVNTTYTVTVTSGNSCTATDDVEVFINPLPPAFAGSDETVCEGESVTLTATGGTTYSWDNGVNQGVSFVPAATNIYTVTVTDVNNCSATDDVLVTVNINPIADAGANEVICEGEIVTLTGNGGASYEWSTLETTQSIDVSPAVTTVYTVTVTAANGCTDSDDVNVTVNPLPVADAGSDQTICEGDNITLTATGGNSYSWSDGVVQGVSFLPISTNTYTVTVQDVNGCTDTDDVIVTVLITPTAYAGVDQTICDGESVTLIATGGVTYNWNNGITQGTPFNPSATNTYTVTVIGANGCSDYDDVDVFVNPLPPAFAGSDEAVCDGGSLTLTATGGTNYEWSTLETTPSIDVTPTMTTTYYVTVTDANLCSAVDDVIVTFNDLPTAFAGNDQEVCDGGSVTLTATGGTSYVWDNGVTQGTPFVPVATATYSVTVTDANTCTGTDDVLVTVNPLPVANAGVNQAICDGESVTLSATGGDSYVWNNGVNQDVPFNPTFTTTYYVTVTDIKNCQDIDTVEVVVYDLPVVDAGIDQGILYGTSTSFDATVFGGTGAYTYYWTPSDSLVDPNIEDPTTTNLTQTNIFTLVVTDDTTGCQSSDNLTVTVTGGPLIVTPYAIADTICEGETAQLFAMPSGGSGIYTFDWTSTPVGFTSTDENPFVTPTVTTTYHVVVDDGSNIANADVIVVVNPLPVADAGLNDTICDGNSVTLSATGGVNYVWDNGVVQDVAFNPISNNTYNVTVTDINGCVDTDDVMVIVDPTPIADAGTDQTICEGESVTLSATGGTIYDWNNGVVQDIAFNPVSTSTYIVTVTNTYDCSDVDSVIVTVNPLPIADAGTDVTICNGEPVTLTATGGTTYDWSGGVTQGAPFNPSVTTTYYVTVTSAEACEAIDSVLVIVNPLPLADAGADTTICDGESVTLIATGGTIYDWSGGITQGISFNPVVTDVYTVTVTDANSCSAIDNLIVTVNELPFVDAGVDYSIPYLTDTILDATVSGGSGSYIYNWTPVDSLIDATIVDPTTINLHATTMFNLLVTDDITGCQNSDDAIVTIIGGPLVVNPDVIPDTICEGDEVQLYALASGGTGTYSYAWTSNPVGFNSSDENPLAYPIATTTYTVEVDDGSNIVSGFVTVFVYPLPVVDLGNDTTICAGLTLTLDAGAGYDEYYWSDGSSTQIITVDTSDIGLIPTLYYVTVTSIEGCETIDNINVTFEICPYITPEISIEPEISIYPNPNDGKLFISYKGFDKKMYLKIYDVDGRLVYNELVINSNNEFVQTVNLTNFAEGAYTIRFISKDFVKIEQLILYR